mmetsp:Transcript_19433/g.42520  ORF Transcript_19433/g.42520 Transcript_19433/m.42520 type:complete len:281 (+) Transcript_19433:193-1035(+)|eukprot:CAMPEP_0118944004 /NCGR_PEP_ID=MMETSP1169-20130426/39446_1 /TAXON_ID=36882 /ORGANISM="Pyramimonas obovata, Strain CCMP722" /LENGTH=280 /DNA_ID=CAMNT_0006889385 /DNA_START=145 /DNA_END=987 /DNA_ORIENTATION=-
MFARFRRIHRKPQPQVQDSDEEGRNANLGPITMKELAILAPRLTLQHLNFAEEKIRSLSINRSSMTTADILKLLQMSGLNPTVPAVEIALRELDLHELEDIDIRSFLKLWSHYMSDLNEELMLAKAFAFFDKDQSGSISTREFVTAMTELGEEMPIEDIDLFVKLIDRNGDNEIQFEELLSALRRDACDFSPDHPDHFARYSSQENTASGSSDPEPVEKAKEAEPRKARRSTGEPAWQDHKEATKQSRGKSERAENSVLRSSRESKPTSSLRDEVELDAV